MAQDRRRWRAGSVVALLVAWSVGAIGGEQLGDVRAAAYAVGSAALAIGAGWPRWRGPAATLLALCAGGAALGGAVADAERASAWIGARGVFEGRIQRVQRAAWGDTARLCDVLRVGAVARRVPGCIDLRSDPRDEPASRFAQHGPGDRIRASLSLRAVGGLRNPGRADPAAARRRAGVGLAARLTHPRLHARVETGPLAGVHRLRARVSDALVALGPGGGLLAALAAGDRSGLAREAGEGFRALGASHLLAVSGLHVGLVALGVYAVSGVLLRPWLPRFPGHDPRRGRLALALLVAGGFALFSGWGVPVRRALCLLLALCVATVRGRPTRRLAPLAAAGLVVLAFDPPALFEPGAQLSFAASAALMLGVPSGAARSLAAVSATALCVTAPLAALHFGSTAPAALGVNLLLVPWASFVLLPAALLAAGMQALPWLVADSFSWVAERLAAGTLLVVMRAAQDLPLVTTGSAAPDPLWIAVAAGVGALSLIGSGAAARVAGAVAVSALLALAPPARPGPPLPRMLVLDVGHGDAVLVQGRRGTLLVDAGARLPGGDDFGRIAALPTLRRLGIARIDLLVASHADVDHRGGLAAILCGLPVGELWVPHGGRDDPAFASLRSAARGARVRLRERGAGDAVVRVGDLAVEPLWPPRGFAGRRNDGSLVLRVEVAGSTALLAGDLEAAGEAGLLASGATLRADVLKLPHHGSRTSTTAAWLAAVAPRVAVASAPCRSRFGLPHAEVVARLAREGVPLWWTGRDGAVWLRLGIPTAAWSVGAPRACPRRARAAAADRGPARDG